MPLLFSYGTLQQEEVQLRTLGRRLAGVADVLPGCEPALVRIEDPAVAAALGTAHHANARFNGNPESRVEGTVFAVTEAELVELDRYEEAYAYRRVAALLGSGRLAWVYVDAASAPDGA